MKISSKMKKIALLTKYSSLAASTRQRFLQFQPLLEKSGFALDHRPLFDDDYLQKVYADRGRNFSRIAYLYVKRLSYLLLQCDADIIWLYCDTFPYLPSIVDMAIKVSGAAIIFDYDDAIFHNYDLHRSIIVRKILGKKLHSVIRSSNMVFCGNSYLADYARPYCRRAEVIPTVVDLSIYAQSFERDRNLVSPTIGWIGTPSTWKEYMVPMMPLLSDIAAREGARITAVGAGQGVKSDPFLDCLPWLESEEVARIQEMSIGIMPLNNTPWARGKCGYKLIQYMSCGLPVVASPVGVNVEIVEHGVNGFLATTEAEWREALTILLSNPALRDRMGREGRRKVEEKYSFQVWGPRVTDLFREVAEMGRAS